MTSKSMNRNFLKATRLLACAGTFLAATTTTQAFPAIDLRADGVAEAIAASDSPRFTWRVESSERGQSQSAWQIIVSSDPTKLASREGDLWDSGKTAATRIPHAHYAGEPLKPGGRYFWAVRVWDAQDNEKVWSEPASFEVAPTTPAHWHGAQWIDDGKDLPEHEADFYKNDPAPLMRSDFELAKPVARARLHVAGLGYALASINGERLADQVLDPPWTNFDERILFRTHDVTAQLTDGANCLGITLGNGWYNLEPLRMWGRRIFREALPSGRPRAIALLVIDHPDGTQTTVTTGPDWKTTEGPSLRHSIFLGEVRDARLAIPGWDTPGFDATSWNPVRVVDRPLEPLQPHLDMPPVRTSKTFPAVAITEPEPGVYIVDFGINFTGLPEMDLRVPAGSEVNMRFGELLHDDGTLNPMSSVAGQIKGTRTDDDGNEVSVGGPGAPPIAWQRATYHALGGGETFIPDFTYYGFRYMEITGLPEAPRVEDFTGHFLNSDIQPVGSFSSSNELFNQIQQITRRTFLANVVSVQSDCPHRERLGYGGDIVATLEAYVMNYDMAGFYAKTVRDWADAALPDGTFTDTAPFVGIQYCGVGWAMVHPLLLENLYTYYGDIDLIREQLPAAIRWFDGEAGRREDGLVTRGLGDHEAIGRIAGPVMLTPMFVDTARRLARLARVIGMEDDATRFDAMAIESAGAWQAEFLDMETGSVGEGSQSELAFALGFDVVPELVAPAVFERLVAALNAADDGPRLTTGIYGTWILLDLLSANGRHDIAYALADRKTFPSWGWMLENGATTLWEDWRGTDGAKSHSHPMFGSISAWFIGWLGGIQPAPDAVGFDRAVIRPHVTADLQWVKSSHQSIRGLIESNWEVTPEGTRFQIVIPPDTTASLELPAGTTTESGRPLTEVEGIVPAFATDTIQAFEVASGSYDFLVK